MAIRTTSTLVRTIIDIAPNEVLSLDAFILTANLTVDSVCLESEYTDVRLELIERWLAAHFFACNRRRTLQQGVGGAVTQQFDRIEVDLKLNNTIYGQQAMIIDFKKNLEILNNSKGGKVSIHWLGTYPCEVVP